MKKFILILVLSPFFLSAQSNIVGDTISANTIYHNIRDTMANCDIDIDGDSFMDVNFSMDISQSPMFIQRIRKVKPLSNIRFACYNSQFADTLPLNSEVNETLNWNNPYGEVWLTNLCMGACSLDLGVFKDDNRYLGFRKIIGNDTLFGWFNLNMGSSTNPFDPSYNILVKSYAYKSTNVGVKDLSMKKIPVKIYPNPTNNFINFEFEGQSRISSIEIINQLGQTVLKQIYSKQIDVSSLNTGCYYIKLTSEDGTILHTRFLKE